MKLIFIFAVSVLLFHNSNARVGQTSTWYYEICKVVVSKHPGDVCTHKCIKNNQEKAPLAWGDDRHLDEVMTKKTREKLNKNHSKTRILLGNTKPLDQCSTLGYCVTYLHMCQTCGTPSKWHPTEILKENYNSPRPIRQTKRTWYGAEPEKYSMPWNVLVRKFSKNDTHPEPINDKRGTCGGTLIDKTTILTAAHCFMSQRGLTLKHIDLFFGNHEDDDLLDKIHDVGVQHRQVYPSSIIKHKGFPSKNDDIAVIQLKLPVQISHMVSPACLPVDLPVDFYMRGNKEHRFVAGAWGRSEFSGAGQYYRQIVVQETKSVTHNLIMAAHQMNRNESEKFRDVCRGDSGSGLMTIHKGKWIVAGFVHAGPLCFLELRQQSGKYMNVPYYIDWIKNRMGNGPETVEK